MNHFSICKVAFYFFFAVYLLYVFSCSIQAVVVVFFCCVALPLRPEFVINLGRFNGGTNLGGPTGNDVDA